VLYRTNGGESTSDPADTVLQVEPTTVAIAQALSGAGVDLGDPADPNDNFYNPGGSFQVAVDFTRTGTSSFTSLGLDTTLPAGFTFAGVDDGASDIQSGDISGVTAGDSGTLNISIDTIPTFPASLVFNVDIDASATGTATLESTANFDAGAGAETSNTESVTLEEEPCVAFTRVVDPASYTAGGQLSVTITFSIDIEASGPIPGPWWMCSFGICRTDDVSVGFKRSLTPLVIEDLSQPDDPDAMRVVAQGVPEVPWDPERDDAENVRALRLHFQETGTEPLRAMEELRGWIGEQTGSDRPVLVGSPVTFDFMWVYWYWWHLLEEMPVTGFSGLDVRSYFMGSHGVGFLGTGKERYLKHYPNEHEHTHDPLEDARQQGRIWHDMVAARESRGKL